MARWRVSRHALGQDDDPSDREQHYVADNCRGSHARPPLLTRPPHDAQRFAAEARPPSAGALQAPMSSSNLHLSTVVLPSSQPRTTRRPRVR
jgi:hypothetical protein